MFVNSTNVLNILYTGDKDTKETSDCSKHIRGHFQQPLQINWLKHAISHNAPRFFVTLFRYTYPVKMLTIVCTILVLLTMILLFTQLLQATTMLY